MKYRGRGKTWVILLSCNEFEMAETEDNDDAGTLKTKQKNIN